MLTLILLKAGVAGVTGLDGMDGLDGVAGVTGMDGMEWLDGVDGMNGMNGLDGMAGVTGLEITITEDTVPGAGEDTNKDKTSAEEAKNTTAKIKNWCKFSYKFYNFQKVVFFLFIMLVPKFDTPIDYKHINPPCSHFLNLKYVCRLGWFFFYLFYFKTIMHMIKCLFLFVFCLYFALL